MDIEPSLSQIGKVSCSYVTVQKEDADWTTVIRWVVEWNLIHLLKPTDPAVLHEIICLFF